MNDEAKSQRDAVGAQMMFELFQTIIPYYMQHGSPCAFPRYRFLAEFDYRSFGDGPTGCHETLTIIEKCFLGGDGCYSRLA
jgi:hypothetical protein